MQIQLKGSDGHTYEVQTVGGVFRPTLNVPATTPEAFEVFRTVDAAWKAILDACKASKVKLTPVARPVHEIAREIRRNWAKVYYGAVPYLRAMDSMQGTENYGADDGSSILIYFLGNANAYRGPLATVHKMELKAIAGVK